VRPPTPLGGPTLDRAADDAGLNPAGAPKLRFPDLRHTFASLLIAEGANVGNERW